MEKPHSYTVAVKTKKDSERWAYNGLRFATEGEAFAWITQLKTRWRDLAEHKVMPTNDQPNIAFPVPSDRYDVKR
jgi:hypothetical protein